MAKLTAQDIVAALVAKGIPEHVAQGVAMNFQDESGLNTGIQEKAPAVGRGGFGLAQWTGPRRVALERFARSQGKPVDDLGTQLDYFMSENQGPEAAAWKQVMSAKTAQDAAIAFVNKWERPRADRAAARTAQYGGKGSTFGQQPPSQTVGSEPLTPAQHPPNPTVGTGGYVAPNAPATSVADATISAPGKTPGAKTDYGKAIAGALGGFGGGAAPQLGEGGQAPQLPSVAPQALPSMAIASGGASDPNYRNALAMLMQHLNSGQIWG